MAPHLYQDQAKYLDLVRSLLPSAVKSAIRSILCTLSASQRAALAAGQSALQARIDALVQRSSSMLTVEQLLVLSARMDAEEHRARVEQFQTLALIFLGDTDNKTKIGFHIRSLARRPILRRRSCAVVSSPSSNLREPSSVRAIIACT